MRTTMTRSWAVVLAASLFVARDVGAAPSMVDQLVDQAEYWNRQGRLDRAADSWRKVLRCDPDHAAALSALVVHHARLGEADRARRFLRRLERAHPGHPDTALLEKTIGVGRRFWDNIQRARSLARTGRVDEALEHYERAFDGEPPMDRVGFEYYQVLSGRKGTWEVVRRGLTRIAEALPSDDEVSLALARHLSYRAATRRDALRRLRALAGRKAQREEVLRAWQAALTWLDARPKDLAQLDAYLALRPKDAKVRALRSSLLARIRDRAVKRGFDAFDRGDIEAAERLFREVASRGDLRGTQGLALVALERGDLETARDRSLELRSRAPDRPELWRPSLQSAQLWLSLREAERALAAGDLEAAAKTARRLRPGTPKELAQKELLLGRIALEQEYGAAALRHLRRAQQDGVADAGVLRALIGVLARAGALEEATEVNRRLQEVDPDAAFEVRSIEAEVLLHEAISARRGGSLDRAASLLAEARARDRRNKWILTELVGVQIERERLDEAEGALDALTAIDPNLDEARVLRARVKAARGDFEGGLTALGSIDGARRTDEVKSLERRLSMQVEVEAAKRSAASGDRWDAERRLSRIEQMVSDAPDLRWIVAGAWSDIGDHERALALFRSAPGRATAAQKLQHAAVLLRAGRDRALNELLAELARERLTPREQRGLDDLRVAWVVRRADQLREQGDVKGALVEAKRALARHPDDTRLLSVFGRALYHSGEVEQAEEIYARVLAEQPRNLEAREGAIMAAAALNQTDRVEALAREGLRQQPADPPMLLLAGRAAAMIGEDDRALRTLAQAREGSGPELREEIDTEIARIHRRRAVRAGPSFEVRHRVGEAGLSALDELRLPIGIEAPVTKDAKVFGQVAPVFLEAGELSASSGDVRQRFGTSGAGPGILVPRDRSLSAQGAALRLGVDYAGFRAWVGSAPFGFPIASVLGGIEGSFTLRQVRFDVEIAREPVRDSLLSYAGVRDPTSGEVWGGVLSNGARLNISYDRENVVPYAFGGYALLTGQNVKENHRGEGGLGIEWRLIESERSRLTAGVIGSFMAHGENLRYFTFGHGGYFSPQLFLHLGVPLRWSGSLERFSWEIGTQVGVNALRESEVDYYPISPDLQVARSLQVDARGALVEAVYPGRGSVGFAFDGALGLAYALADPLEAGVRFQLHVAQDYQEAVGNIFVRFAFGPG